jgi:outer membrane protein assembly factor BamB
MQWRIVGRAFHYIPPEALRRIVMRNWKPVPLVMFALLLARPLCAEIHIYVADHENRKLIKIKEDGTLLWEFPNNNGHDVQLLKNGNVLIVTGEVQEVTPTKEIVWSVGRPTIQKAEAAQRLPNGHTMIADDRAHAIIDLDENKKEVWRFEVPNSNNRRTQTMRQVRRLENGNTLICASTLDEVWEVNPAKEIVWKFQVPFPYLALRLENGNTLISSGDGYGSPRGWYVIEVDKEGKEVWKFGGADAPDEQRLRFPTGMARMRDGSTYIAEAQNRTIKHISPDKKILRTITSPAMRHPCTIVVVEVN